MALEVSLPTLGAVLGTAVIDAVNPCAIGTLILLISTIIVAGRQKEMLKIGLIYIFAGLVEIKDYFWYGKGFSLMIPHKSVHAMEEKMKKLSAKACILLGVFVA